VASRVRYSASVYLAKALERLMLKFLDPAETIVRESYGDYIHTGHLREVITKDNILEGIVRSVHADYKNPELFEYPLPYDYVGDLIRDEKKKRKPRMREGYIRKRKVF
jgi:hypothetical protein